MFNFNELRQVHLEITNNCQASCPMCTRNINGGLENPLIKLESWTLERYKIIFTEEVLNQIDQVYFCGNYGDPLLNNDLLEMIKYSVGIKSNIQVRIHTNGSLRNVTWWKELALAMPDDHMIVFAIDGLVDTHSLYRIGTDYDQILRNAASFIQAGGKAEWAFIRFKHNEHQVDKARTTAKEIGFDRFVMKDSSRFLLDAKFPVYNKQGSTRYHLEPSQYSEIKFIDKKIVDNYKSILKNIEIDCHALKTKEIYISAQGLVFPCCWLAMTPYLPIEHEAEFVGVRKEILDQYHILVESLGGESAINANLRPIKDIINSNEYQSVWTAYWSTNKLITCARSCGKMPELFSTPKDQFTKTEIL